MFNLCPQIKDLFTDKIYLESFLLILFPTVKILQKLEAFCYEKKIFEKLSHTNFPKNFKYVKEVLEALQISKKFELLEKEEENEGEDKDDDDGTWWLDQDYSNDTPAEEVLRQFEQHCQSPFLSEGTPSDQSLEKKEIIHFFTPDSSLSSSETPDDDESPSSTQIQELCEKMEELTFHKEREKTMPFTSSTIGDVLNVGKKEKILEV